MTNRLPYYEVDAFTDRPFAGNPAGVCLLEAWLPDDTLQSIAAENNLSETAFVVETGDRWALRWFTPTVEVDLCGHATLATAHVLFTEHASPPARVTFDSCSGPLLVERDGDRLVLDFPARPPASCPAPPGLVAALGAGASAVLRSDRDLMVVFDDEETVRGLTPDTAAIARIDALGVIVTASGRDVDFVSRFFAPRVGVAEDPVTGSAHCTLVPHWAARLGRAVLHAQQVSGRGGELWCEHRGNRVRIAGHAVTYLRGTIVAAATAAAAGATP